MAELVIQSSNGNDVTTSLIVAQVFGKEHKNVLRDIESLSCSEDFNRLNFERITYKDARNREQTAYEMTKDGFSFLVMGYTGSKAGEFKERFINEFNRREALLKNDDYILMRSQQILQKRIEIAEQKIKQLEDKNAKQEPYVFICKDRIQGRGESGHRSSRQNTRTAVRTQHAFQEAKGNGSILCKQERTEAKVH